MRRVRVSIDTLILRGFPPESRHAVAAALRRELSRVLAGPGAAERLSQRGDTPRLRAGRIEMSPGADAERVGTRAGARIGQLLLDRSPKTPS